MVSPARGTTLSVSTRRMFPLASRSLFQITVCAGLMVAIGVAVPVSARGDADDTDVSQAPARPLFNEGLEYPDAGRWQEAADRFGRAYQSKPTAEIAYNLAQAYVRL